MTDPKRPRGVPEQHEREIAILRELTRQMASNVSPARIATSTCEQILRAAGCDMVALYFREGDDLIRQGFAASGPTVKFEAAMERSLGDWLAAFEPGMSEPVYSTDVMADPRCPFHACTQTGVRSLAALPIVFGKEILGVLWLASLEKRDFSQQSYFLETLAAQIAVSVRCSRVCQQLRGHAAKEAEEAAGIKEAPETLRGTDALFKALFESAQDCIFLKDRNLVYTHVNPALAKLLGVNAKRIVGRTEEALFDLGSGKDIRDLDRRVLRGQVVQAEYSRTVGDKVRVFHEIRAPLKDARGKIAGLCGIAREITDRMKTLDVSGPSACEYPSEAMRTALQEARLAAAGGSTILLTGESGAGKDFFAHFIHAHSERAGRPFYAINCAAIPLELAESELFGHEAGAFTGARRRKPGMFEVAHRGTLLLNEIGELPLPIQAKLLTFLDSKTFTRVGGEKPVTVDVRIIAATNRDLKEEVSQGRFREDLFYRLNVFAVRVPSLRQRVEDIPSLVREITYELASEMHLVDIPVLAPETLAMMRRHSWPGNVRELRNLLERTLVLYATNGLIEGEPLRLEPHELQKAPVQPTLPQDKSMGDLFDDMERSLIEEALQKSGGKKDAAAKLLGISRHALKRRLSKYPELSRKALKK
ncbi:MAG: sigma 54-interacting transcriptional regulator [Thermodesulfobacteriota bacterium]